MKIVSELELAAVIAGLDVKGGAEFVSIFTSTEPKMLKTGNPFYGRVQRVCTRMGMFGASYENAVNAQRTREGSEDAGSFRAEALWKGHGKHISKSLAQHTGTGKLYAVFYPSKNAEDGAKVKDDVWTLDGTEVDSGMFAAYLPKPSAGRQEVESPIMWRVISLENIISMVYSKETYIIRH